MTEAEKKKYRSKQRKAELKAQQEAEEKKKAAASVETSKKTGAAAKVDEDPEGTKYTKTEDPLGEALKFLKPLQELASDRIETHLMGFEIYIRKSR